MGLTVLTAKVTRPVIPSEPIAKIAVYTRNKPKAEITVAVIDGDRTNIRCYGKNGAELQVTDRIYEIGDITKTFTGAMVAKAVLEERMRLQDRITDHMVLNPGTYAPTVFELLTHTSAYGDYPRIRSRAGDTNPYAGIDYPKVITSMDDFRLNQTPPYLYSYSNLGATVMGMTLEDTYGVTYCSLLNDFLNELGLRNTYIALSSEEAPDGGWVWSESDEYMASIGLCSNIEDMIRYARLYIDGKDYVLNYACAPLIEVNMETDVGYFWALNQSGILEQNGETANYSSQILIDRANKRAVIVLSNYPSDRFGSVEDIAKSIINESSLS